MSIVRTFASSFAQLLWPAHCAGCDVLVPSDDVIFCAACAPSMNPIESACAGCALPRGESGDAAGAASTCRSCARGGFAFTRAFAAFEYGEALASAIMRMKHGGRLDLAPRLGRLLAGTMARAIGGGGGGGGKDHGRGNRGRDHRVGDDNDARGDDVRAGDGLAVDAVLPVPLHPRKLRARGFNQSLALAKAARAWTLVYPRPGARAMLSRPRIDRGLLLRVRDTRELGRAGPDARRAEVRDAFAVAKGDRVAGGRYLIVDDVMTTGATLHACASVLLRAGARDVRVLALARAVL